MNNNFSDWTKEDFARWLRENHPKPNARWTGVTFQIRHSPKDTFEFIMADDYETCIDELARELVMQAGGMTEEQCSFVIQPAKRRKKKRMWLYTTSES